MYRAVLSNSAFAMRLRLGCIGCYGRIHPRRWWNCDEHQFQICARCSSNSLMVIRITVIHEILERKWPIVLQNMTKQGTLVGCWRHAYLCQSISFRFFVYTRTQFLRSIAIQEGYYNWKKIDSSFSVWVRFRHGQGISKQGLHSQGQMCLVYVHTFCRGRSYSLMNMITTQFSVISQLSSNAVVHFLYHQFCLIYNFICYEIHDERHI